MVLPTNNAMFLTFRVNENISIQPASYILLQCENISTLEWHAFTITDFAVEPTERTVFTLAVSVQGDWTSELYQKILKLKLHNEKTRRRSKTRRRKLPAPRKLRFIVDGPFPSQMESILNYERVVLIGTGIAVTPFISIFNFIMWESSHEITKSEINFVVILKEDDQNSIIAAHPFHLDISRH